MPESALDILREIYNEQGPRAKAGLILPADQFAKMTKEEVDAKWDFDSRQLMHRAAKVILRADRRR